MTARWLQIYRRLDALQGRRGVVIALVVLVLMTAGSAAGWLVAVSLDLASQRARLVEALTGGSLAAGDEIAISLREYGTVVVSGREYGHPRLKERPDLIFDESGRIAVPGSLAEVLLRDRYPERIPRWLLEQSSTTWTVALIVPAWLLLIVLMRLTLQLLLTALGTLVVAGSALLAGWTQAAVAVAGIGFLTFSFLLLIRVASFLLDSPRQTLAVAHTVLREASRTRIALVFIGLLLVLLPLLPLGLDPDAPLRYRLQTFISRSLGLTFYVAACLTLIVGCATVAFEIRDRQIWHVMTKPVHRLQYLAGKWLGLITVNAILLVIAAVSIFTFIQFLRTQPVASGLSGAEDLQQVRDGVLTARVGSEPEYPRLTEEQIRQRVEAVIERDPILSTMAEIPPGRRRALREEVIAGFNAGLRSVPPGAARTYRFTGLGAARTTGTTVSLRYKFYILRDDEHRTFPVEFIFNENPDLSIVRDFVPTMTHVLPIPAELISPSGELLVTVHNLFMPPPEAAGMGSINFEAQYFEVLHRAGSFEGNFVRAMLVHWTKLAFLAMLAIACATFLSFPVACLTAFTIFLGGTVAPFLALSLRLYEPPELGRIDPTDIALLLQWAFQSAVRGIAMFIVMMLESFGAYNPTQRLVEGRLIPWREVAGSGLRIGVLWTALAAVVGWIVLRRRELATYSGQG